MQMSYVVVFLIGFLATLWMDRKELKRAKRGEKAIYWTMVVCTISGFLCSYANVHVPMPTEVIVYKFAPWFHQFTKA
ncbi:hypothetical protein [Tumebacillus flagellatus]|uniref:Uncharacterized protein n=1 Tax=Tumebacillus flagellatus TaxID=1157490 RepID=A0A074MGG1_9BACL|nr:hypothetical protein [Tumebacillus flagellatus]KEO84802.1 hypothetical protein EL26_01975 [Tumebacillus flagellatus]